MRRLILLALVQACAKVTDVTVPPAESTLIVTFSAVGSIEDVRAYTEPATLELPHPAGRTVAILQFDATWTALSLPIADGRLITAEPSDPVTVGLPLPDRWIEITGGERTDLAPVDAAFEARFGTVKIALCPPFGSPRAAVRRSLEGDRDITMAARLGDDTVVLSRSASVALALPSTIELVTRAVQEPLGDLRLGPRGAFGFSLPNHHVWFMYYDEAAPEVPRLCQVAPGSPPRCEPMRVEGPEAGNLVPIAITGRVFDDRLAIAILNYDGGLWLGSPGGAWRMIARRGGDTSDNGPCSVGLQTLALDLDGPTSGIVSFPAGQLLHFTVTSTGGTRFDRVLTPDQHVRNGFCRSAFGRAESGIELLALQDFNTDQTTTLEEEPNFFWRRPKEAGWTRAAYVPNLDARRIVRLGDRLIVSGNANDMRVVDIVPSQRVPVHFCPPFFVGHRPDHLVSFEGGDVFVGGGLNGKVQQTTWLDLP